MQPPDEIKKIELFYPNHIVVPAELSLWDEDPEMPTSEHIRLALRFGDREIISCKETYWEAFCAIRAQLEQENVLVRCYGGSQNVYPSGMCLSMGMGNLAYRTQFGQPARTADLVNIFDTGPDVDPATLAEQNDFHNKWVGIFRKTNTKL